MNVDLEGRLRRALGAQAARVTPERLRPAIPPTALPVRRPATMFVRRAGWVAAMLLLVAVVVTVTLRPAGPEPQQPPVIVTPSPSGSSGPPSPSPLPSPSRSPSPTALLRDGVIPLPGDVVSSPTIGSSAPPAS